MASRESLVLADWSKRQPSSITIVDSPHGNRCHVPTRRNRVGRAFHNEISVETTEPLQIDDDTRHKRRVADKRKTAGHLPKVELSQRCFGDPLSF